ncbi:hypothetical protein EC968_006669, partial [Mortierella alpina]
LGKFGEEERSFDIGADGFRKLFLRRFTYRALFNPGGIEDHNIQASKDGDGFFQEPPAIGDFSCVCLTIDGVDLRGLAWTCV